MAMDATLLVEGESVSSEDESIVRSRIDIPLRDRNAQSEGNEESGLEWRRKMEMNDALPVFRAQFEWRSQTKKDFNLRMSKNPTTAPHRSFRLRSCFFSLAFSITAFSNHGKGSGFQRVGVVEESWESELIPLCCNPRTAQCPWRLSRMVRSAAFPSDSHPEHRTMRFVLNSQTRWVV